MQVTYDKLETTNLYSPHFGRCRDDKIELGEDTTLTIGPEAKKYQVCHGTVTSSLVLGACSACLFGICLLRAPPRKKFQWYTSCLSKGDARHHQAVLQYCVGQWA